MSVCTVLLGLIVTSSLLSAIPLPDVEESKDVDAEQSRDKRFVKSLALFAGEIAFGSILRRASRGRAEIEVKNWIPGSSIDVHCKSGSNDKGRSRVRYEEGYMFSFRPSFWGSTHYWCDVWWDGKQHEFPAYGEGAPEGSNAFDVTLNGIYMNRAKIHNW